MLTSAPILRTPGKNDTLVLETDASNIGIGACLKFLDAVSGHVHIVAFTSHKFTKSELNWNIVEKECYAVIYSLRHYRHFLLNTHFIVKVDNRIITYLNSKHNLKNHKLLNWALELSDYDYEIVHIPSTHNQMSDCLSRITSLSLQDDMIVPGVSCDELIQEQMCDHELTHVYDFLNSNDRKHFDLRKLGLFKRYSKDLHKSSARFLMWRDKVVIPSILKEKVLTTCHDEPMSGHFAEKRTLLNFTDKYLWPTAIHTVRNLVQICVQCNKFNPPVTGYQKAPLQPILSDNVFKFVCYDIAGPFFPITEKKNQCPDYRRSLFSLDGIYTPTNY